MDKAIGTKAKVLNIIKLIILFATLFLYMIPFFIIVINSFKSKKAIIRNPIQFLDPKGATMANFIKAYTEMNFINSFFNSLFITVLSVAIIVILASMTAHFFVRNKWKINNIIFSIMLAAMIIPFQVIMIPLVSIYGGTFHLLDHKLTLVFLNIGFGMSLATFIYHGFVKTGIPLAIEEAATIDGCTKLQTFFKIVFPLLKPTTSTIIVLDVLWIWNDYLLPSLVLTKKDLFTLPLSTYAFYGTYSVDYGAIMAGLVLTVIPVIVLYIFLQKQIINGVVSGAVKE